MLFMSYPYMQVDLPNKFAVQLSVIYYVDSLRSGYYAYGFYQKPCEEGMAQFQKTVEMGCQKILTNSQKFAMKMTTSFHIPVFSIHQQCVVPQYFLESLCLYHCTAVCNKCDWPKTDQWQSGSDVYCWFTQGEATNARQPHLLD
jgi:hypothetical protein